MGGKFGRGPTVVEKKGGTHTNKGTVQLYIIVDYNMSTFDKHQHYNHNR